MPTTIDLYAGIELISSHDKTPKALRRGNYYHAVENKSQSGVKYISFQNIEKINSRIQRQSGRI